MNAQPERLATPEEEAQFERASSIVELAEREGERLDQLDEKATRCHYGVVASFQHGISYAIEAGEALVEAKEIVGHGHFLAWLRRSTFPADERTARRYMQLARYPDRTRVSDLSIRGALKQITSEARADKPIYLIEAADFAAFRETRRVVPDIPAASPTVTPLAARREMKQGLRPLLSDQGGSHER